MPLKLLGLHAPRSMALLLIGLVASSCSGRSGDDNCTAGQDCAAAVPESAPDNTETRSLQTPELCDGSEAVRVLFQSYYGGERFIAGFGYRPPFLSFSESYGAGFWAIDGNCHVYVGDAMGAVTTVDWSADRAQAFARAVRFGHLPQWSESSETCTGENPPYTQLWTADRSLTCSCSCESGSPAPADVRAAFDAQDVAYSLAEGGTPVGAAQLVLIPVGDVDLGLDPEVEPTPVVEWPLERRPANAEMLADTLSPDSGARIDDPAELALLRGVRYRVARYPDAVSAGYTLVHYVVPQSQSFGDNYYMLLRDIAPPALANVLQPWR